MAEQQQKTGNQVALTFYDQVRTLQQLLDRQETLQTEQARLAHTFPHMARRDHFKAMHSHLSASIADCKQLIAEYEALNREAEAENDKPVDYQEALARMIVNAYPPDQCKHPTDSWITVYNVPTELRQYNDDKDWLCAMCGMLVPRFDMSSNPLDIVKRVHARLRSNEG